jgi:beta-galactosidase
MLTLPFLFGAQYYRAPTPEPDVWDSDHRKMRELGFNAVKYWVQWRWAHRLSGNFYFNDLDRLMSIAEANGLRVTLNTIFDVSPHWLFEKYPDARQVQCNGHLIKPYTVAHRQIGGHPGPCYNHPGAKSERQRFLKAAIEHFRGHPALAMWDMWNEPELSFPQRNPQVDTMACYCHHCQEGFLEWLQTKYENLDHLNRVWGRCYETWGQVEVPRNPHTITDYIDWREFHIETMTREAAWRLEMVAEMDPIHTRYLHVVPNVMSIFNSVSCCADDFALADLCQVFAATMNGGPVYAPQVLSAARGKLCFNVESHVNFGMTNMHQRRLNLDDLLRDWLPQIGLGIRGFLFWQYRPEVLGYESPAWGVVGLDGSDRPVTKAVREFWQKLQPHTNTIINCPPPLPEIGIWKSRKNEIFHFCIHQSLANLIDSVEGYIHALYWRNYAYRIISGEMLARGELDGLKLLIMPSCYYLTEEEASQLDQWVCEGGVLLAEAHLAGYNGSTGRHSRVIPGCSLAESWGVRETDSTSSFHLKVNQAEGILSSFTEDVRKALEDLETAGGLYFPIRLTDGITAWGADRYATLSASSEIQPQGWFEPDSACLASLSRGKGWIFYAGTNLGQGAKMNPDGLHHILLKLMDKASVLPIFELTAPIPGQVRIDPISDQEGNALFLVVQNRSFAPQMVSTHNTFIGQGLFSEFQWDSAPGKKQELPAEFIDIILRQD